MRQTLVILSICLILFACKKQAVNTGIDAAWGCDLIEDSATTSTNILGTWKWTKRLSPTGTVLLTNKNIRATFKPDTTYTVMENSSVLAQGTWGLQSLIPTYWSLSLTVPNEYVKGFMLFCNNQVVFVDSYVDGYNTYFIKEN